MKLQAKEKAVKKIQDLTGISLNPKALMDVQVKRIHEYKRQLLNLLSIVHRYQHIKSLSPEERKKVCFLHVRSLSLSLPHSAASFLHKSSRAFICCENFQTILFIYVWN